jgi:hypothetical protein
MADPTFINGAQYDHGVVTIKFRGKAYAAIKSIEYKSKIARKMFGGTASFDRGRTRGKASFEGKIVWYKTDDGGFDELVSDLGDGWMEEEGEITVSYGKNGQPVTTDTLHRVQFGSDEASTSEGEDGLEVSTDLSIMGIKRNGKAPIKGMKF